MSVTIPERLADLLKPETRAFAYLALTRSDGTPHVTPIWFDYDGKYFIFNTQRGRVKDNIMHKHPVVGFVIADPKTPTVIYRSAGQSSQKTEEGGADSIRDLNQEISREPQLSLESGRCARDL